MKKSRIVIYLILSIFLVSGFTFLYKKIQKPDVDFLIDFVKKNPERASVYFVRNDSVLVDISSDKKFPLASTVKIIIATEYAQQISSGKIKPDEMVPLADLNLFYLPNTDGNAHPNWLAEMKEKNQIQDQEVSLENVAKGMIKYSSNANTEYLQAKLGFDNINNNLKKLNLSQHEKLFPIVSSLFIFSNKNKKDNDIFLSEIKKLSQDEYTKKCFEIHQKLKIDYDTTFKKSLGPVNMILQKEWSDRLTASTTKEYVSIMQKINSRTYFDAKTQDNLEKIMETSLENPNTREFYEHYGWKGGSTGFVLTMSIYAKTRAGDKLELAIFFGNLTVSEQQQLSNSIIEFRKLMFRDRTFYQKKLLTN
jgi:D-alanyl-D-alanine carboxypeptidase